jgi:hypothetical protein
MDRYAEFQRENVLTTLAKLSKGQALSYDEYNMLSSNNSNGFLSVSRFNWALAVFNTNRYQSPYSML